jgi:hypothetical protein
MTNHEQPANENQTTNRASELKPQELVNWMRARMASKTQLGSFVYEPVMRRCLSKASFRLEYLENRIAELEGQLAEEKRETAIEAQRALDLRKQLAEVTTEKFWRDERIKELEAQGIDVPTKPARP